jgi:ABC-2 type transport system ATP-binding protein
VVSVRGLVRRYGGREAVAGIDLEVQRGEIFAFLGPNGTGKTTAVEIFEGFRQRTQGQVCVLGQDPAAAGGAWRDRVGACSPRWSWPPCCPAPAGPPTAPLPLGLPELAPAC